MKLYFVRLKYKDPVPSIYRYVAALNPDEAKEIASRKYADKINNGWYIYAIYEEVYCIE